MNATARQRITESPDSQPRIRERTLARFGFAIPFHVIAMDDNGLIFRYVGNDQWFINPRTIDISHDSDSVRNLPVSSIADFPVPSDLVRTRHHCLQFTDLSPQQREQLHRFIARQAMFPA
ncbi:MAG: hypothetical protein ACOY32_11230 [Thermodesulfobacteriota bacterium]